MQLCRRSSLYGTGSAYLKLRASRMTVALRSTFLQKLAVTVKRAQLRLRLWSKAVKKLTVIVTANFCKKIDRNATVMREALVNI